MDQIGNLVAWYEANAFIVMPILISIFILGVSLGAFQLTHDRMLRAGLLLPVGGILLALSFSRNEYAAELFLNLSMHVFMVLVALLIVGFVTQTGSWMMPIVIVVVVAVGLQLVVPHNNIASNIPTTFGVGLIGAMMMAFMLRQEWAWSPIMKERRLSAAMRQARQEQAQMDAEFGDFFMLIAGSDEDYIEQKIDFLKQHDMSIVRDNPAEYDDEMETYYRLINAKIETVVKDRETLFLHNNEARVRIIAFPDTTKRVLKQMSEVLVANEQKRIEASENAEMLHIEFKTNPPQKLYSTVLEEKIYALAREWQYGEDDILQQAVDDLLAWAKSENLIQK